MRPANRRWLERIEVFGPNDSQPFGVHRLLSTLGQHAIEAESRVFGAAFPPAALASLSRPDGFCFDRESGDRCDLDEFPEASAPGLVLGATVIVRRVVLEPDR